MTPSTALSVIATKRAETELLLGLAEAATPGPWAVEEHGSRWITAGSHGLTDVIVPNDVDCGAYCQGGASRYWLSAADATFIAALSPAVVSDLLRERLAVLDADEALLREHRPESEGSAICRCQMFLCPVQVTLLARYLPTDPASKGET